MDDKEIIALYFARSEEAIGESEKKYGAYCRTIAGNILPATWFMEIMKTLFLAGDNMNIIGRNCLVLLGYAATFMALAARFTRKSLD